MTTRSWIGCWSYLAVALVGCGGEATSSSQGNPTSSNAGATTGTQPPTTMGDPASGATTLGISDTANTSAAAVTTGVAGSGGSTSNAESTANSSGGGEDGLGCTGSCEACPEGSRRLACTPACLCELEDDPVRAEHERLLACEWEQPCTPAWMFYVGNAGNPIYSFLDTECLFAALRDRTAGRFDFSVEAYAGFGLEYAAYSFLLDGSDSLLVLHWGYWAIPSGTASHQRVFSEVESCTLTDPSMFDACIADPESCATIDDWFQACVAVSEPSCPTE